MMCLGLINKNWSRKLAKKKKQIFGPVWVIGRTGPETYHLIFQSLGLINKNWSRKLAKKQKPKPRMGFGFFFG